MKIFFPLVFFTFLGFGQVTPTAPNAVLQALQTKNAQESVSLFKNNILKSIGPTIMSGRVADIEVNPDDPTEFYVGYASGGVWHTKNNGTSFSPIMDNAPSINVGDIGVHWPTRTIWVGTGENISSRSSYAGIGMLKTTDNGTTWQHMGLRDAHHFGRILVNPNNPNHVVVGVTGHLYSPNEQRGMFTTTDGGTTWKQTLFINNTTGVIDVAHAPNNFAIQYAAAWQKDRKAWDFVGNGNASGVYKSTDAGASWSKISTPESGFPTGEGVGRIGFAVYDDNTVYAVLDNQFRRPKTGGKSNTVGRLALDDFKEMSSSAFVKLDTTDVGAFLKRYNFPKNYTPALLKELVASNQIQPKQLGNYWGIEDPTTPVIGAEVYRSDDAGKTWNKQNETYIDDLFYSYGYVFAQIRVDAADKNKIYLLGVPIIKSSDGGNTFSAIQQKNVHVDHHSLWVNPKKAGHLINGNDGGVNISYDDGETWVKNNSTPVGTFFAVNVDLQEPYNVYGGLQDNGVWMGPHNAKIDLAWQQTGHHPWKGIMGGDGMQIQIDARDPNIVFTGSQFGEYSKLNLKNNTQTAIKPQHKIGEDPYRFNWESPILLSSHNQDILYMGTNKLMRSMNQGSTWEAISPDLTRGSTTGNVPYGTLTTLSESPLQFGLLYAGSDDGLVHVSKNGGSTWEHIGKQLPELATATAPLWVSTALASAHKKERVYLCLSGYRYDDFTSYIYQSDDYGATWKNIVANMPNASVNVLIEDAENQNLLFVGTDNGLYASINQGESWEPLQNGMPNVAVHDLVIQPVAKDLVVATHGRGIYKTNIAALQQLTLAILEKDLYVYALENIPYSEEWGNAWSSWSVATTPGIDLVFYTKVSGSFDATVLTQDGIAVSATRISADKGLNVLSYDVAFSKAGKDAYLKKHKALLPVAKDGKTYLPKGTYSLEIEGNGKKESTLFSIE